MTSLFFRRLAAAFKGLALGLAVSFFFVTPAVRAQYRQVNIVSDVPGLAQNTDPNLRNSWGMAFFPDSPFWVSDNDTGVSTLYQGPRGTPVPLVVTIPPAPSQPFGPVGSPTGVVANATTSFVVSENGASGAAAFLFATLDGTISGWNPGVDLTHAVIAVDNSASSAQYTGLALASTSSGHFLYAADAVNNHIDMFDGKFNLVKSFADPEVPASVPVYGIHLIRGKLYVTFSSNALFQGGFVDVFDTDGNLLQRLTSNGPAGPLEGPWGVAIAPANFGKFSHDILVGNVDDGKISAFDPQTGRFLGQIEDAHGNVIANPGLWSLAFGSGDVKANGAANQLFFTAGINNYADGLLGAISAQ
jgi:uncharacterized protein (TIGR03118 family)